MGDISFPFPTDPASDPASAMRSWRLEAADGGRFSGSLEAARTALDAGQANEAIDILNQALLMKPDDAEAHVLRGEARLLAGQDLAALHDFHVVLAMPTNAPLSDRARFGAVTALEQQGEFEAALSMLDAVSGVAVEPLRARLQRMVKGEPAIWVQAVEQLVMHDMLQAVPVSGETYHGYFAVQIAQVGRAWAASADAWAKQFLNSSYNFVELLGHFRQAVGDPMFALRLMASPSSPITDHRPIQIALIGRVTGSDEAACRAHAIQVWQTLMPVLPGADSAYFYKPVSDEDDLQRLLNPIEVDYQAEIVRREEVPGERHHHYTVYPFTLRSFDLHHLCLTLQRQPSAVMLSIHLLPTALMAWEVQALNQTTSGVHADLYPIPVGEDDSGSSDPISQWWKMAPRMEMAQINRHVLNGLRNNAYVLGVNVAAAAGSNPLFAGQIASALFGTPQSSDGVACGGYDIVVAESPTEVEVARRNLISIDVEDWLPNYAPENARRLRHLVTETEAALAFRLPIPGGQGVPGLSTLQVRPVPPPANLSSSGTLLGQSVAQVGGHPVRIRQDVIDRQRHLYVVGKTGTGKSTLLKNMALQDIEAGRGVCVVDPHGDLVEEILDRIPSHRKDDIILFDPSDDAFPIGLNLLEARNETEKYIIVNEFIGLLLVMYDPYNTGIVGPRFQHNVRNAMLTVMSAENTTLIEVVRALTDNRYVRELLPLVKDPLVKNYWTNQIANTSDFHKSEILDYIVSKFSRFVGDQRIRNIIGQTRTTLDFRRIMDEQKVLLVNLSKGKIGPENAQFLGLLLVQRLLLTALGRADVAANQRPNFMLYVDEFQNFATSLFATILSEGRKYGISVVAANQYLSQLSSDLREAVFGNIGSIISFNLGIQDALTLAPELHPVFTADDLITLPRYTACVKLSVDGGITPPFTMRTLPDLRQPNPQQSKLIRAYSREQYGRDATVVTAEILARFGMKDE